MEKSMKIGMKIRKRNKVQSLNRVSLTLLVLLGIAMAGLLTFLVLGLNENRKLAGEYVKDTAELYVNQLNRDIAQINSELVYIQEQNENIEQLGKVVRPQDAKYYQAMNRIENQNRILKIRYSEVQKFYVYAQDSGVFVSDGGVVFPSSIRSELYDALMKVLEEQPGNSRTTSWQILQTSTNNYIVSWYFKKSRGLGCIIDVDDVFDNLQKNMKNYQAIPFIKDVHGTILMPDGISEELKKKLPNLEKSANLCKYRLEGIGQINLYIVPGSGMQERILMIQVLFLIFILVLVVLCSILLYVYYGKILSPMRTFVEALDQTDEEQMLNEDGTNNILELEFASDKFRTLLRKIQSLKIAIYEKELQEQKAELEYVQEQLRPHFLLNCLSVIHGMADERGEKEIVHMIEGLSEYMRYVMRDSKKQRPIEEELNHVKAYVEMQKLRYGETAFSYEVILDGDVEGCLLPPLLLQILVENSIVHEVSLDRKIDISVYVTIETYEDGEYLYLCISDTGNGFSEETLQALKNDTPIVYNGRKHVGLQNIQRRLTLLYGEKGSVEFSNMDENYGAVVEVRMPVRRNGGKD